MAREELSPLAAGAILLLSGIAWAQDQRPLPRDAPQAFAHLGVAVHVVTHDELEPDRLRSLARRDVTLWLKTRTNTLRDSTVEHLARFDVAFVQLRPPLKPVDARVLAKAPRAGVWAKAADAPELVGRLPGVRQLAVDVDDTWPEALDAVLAKVRPALVRFRPAGPVDVLTWGRFLAAPGRKIYAPDSADQLALECATPAKGVPTPEVHVATLMTVASRLFPCAEGTRVVIDPGAEPWLLQSLLVREPRLELVVHVDDDAQARKAKLLLDTLGLERR